MVAKTTKKFSVKELQQRTDGNEMDLSMSQIEDIPVKDIATVKKVDSLDLSINLIVKVPDDFCVLLQRLVKLDLSKNKLKELPEKFGSLQQLQHLDLYHNQLRLIPVSFSQMKKLKWLDLKDNPLDSSYRKHVGDCLNDQQCRQCAKGIVAAMKQILAKKEQQRAKKLEQQKKAQLLKEEQELAVMKKREKNQEKKRRRKERELKAKQQAQNGSHKAPAMQTNEEIFDETESDEEEPILKQRSGCGMWFFGILVMLLAIGAGVYFSCAQNRSVNHCRILYDYIESIRPMLQPIWEKVSNFGGQVAQYAGESFLVLKVECSKMINHLYTYYENWT